MRSVVEASTMMSRFSALRAVKDKVRATEIVACTMELRLDHKEWKMFKLLQRNLTMKIAITGERHAKSMKMNFTSEFALKSSMASYI